MNFLSKKNKKKVFFTQKNLFSPGKNSPKKIFLAEKSFLKKIFQKTKNILKTFDFHPQNLFSGKNQNLEKTFLLKFAVFGTPLSPRFFPFRRKKRFQEKGEKKSFFKLKSGKKKTFSPEMKKSAKQIFSQIKQIS